MWFRYFRFHAQGMLIPGCGGVRGRCQRRGSGGGFKARCSLAMRGPGRCWAPNHRVRFVFRSSGRYWGGRVKGLWVVVRGRAGRVSGGGDGVREVGGSGWCADGYALGGRGYSFCDLCVGRSLREHNLRALFDTDVRKGIRKRTWV